MPNVRKTGETRGGHGGVPKQVTPEEVEQLALNYMERCKEEDEPLTATGLAIALGFKSRQSLYDYRKDPDYKDAINKAMLYVENGYEIQMARGRGDGGIVFALKNFGWTDKQELDHTSSDGSMSQKEQSVAVLEALRSKHKE
jgi:hypothetical protein